MSNSMLRSTGVVSAMTLLSRVLGLLRDVLLASLGGAGAAMDAFFVAFRIPCFLRLFFAEGGFTQAFVPVFASYRDEGDERRVRLVVAQVAGTLGGVLLIITLVAELAAPLVALPFASGFKSVPGKFELTVSLLHITFPYLLCVSLAALAGGVLNSYGRFAAAAFAPVLLNLCLIAAATIFVDYAEVPQTALAWGVFTAGLAQVTFLWWRMAKLGFVKRPRWAWRAAPIRKIVRLMTPAAFGSSIVQINLLLDVAIASFLVSGSVSWLYYSDRLVAFPMGVLTIAIATVILPSLSTQHAGADRESFSKTLDWALRIVTLLITPATVGLFVLAGPLIATMFQRGEFGHADVTASQVSLMGYSFGLMGYTFVKVLIPGFFARHDTLTPVRVGIWALAVNIALNLVIVVPMAFSDWPYPHVGLAAATSAGAFVNALTLGVILYRQGVLDFQPGWGSFVFRVAVANLIMAIGLYYFRGDMAEWLTVPTLDKVLRLGALVLSAAVAYFVALVLLGLRPWALYGAAPTASETGRVSVHS